MKPIRRTLEWLFLLPVPLLGLGWLLGWLLRDRADGIIWLYFIPAPAVVALGVLWFLFTKRSVHRVLRFLVAMTSLAALAKMGLVDFAWHPDRPAPEGSLRIVHWNAAHTVFGFKPVLQAVKDDRADIVLLSESRESPDLAYFAERELGLPYAHQDQGMALLSRFPVAAGDVLPVANGRAWHARVQTPSGPLDVMAVDLISHPLLDRRLPIDAVAAWAAARDSSVPLLIAGDFNTPRDARVFRVLRADFRHAYEIAGRGWPYTWPLPVPVYAIDHLWVSPGIAVHRYRLRAAKLSDHRRQILDLSLP